MTVQAVGNSRLSLLPETPAKSKPSPAPHASKPKAKPKPQNKPADPIALRNSLLNTPAHPFFSAQSHNGTRSKQTPASDKPAHGQPDPALYPHWSDFRQPWPIRFTAATTVLGATSGVLEEKSNSRTGQGEQLNQEGDAKIRDGGRNLREGHTKIQQGGQMIRKGQAKVEGSQRMSSTAENLRQTGTKGIFDNGVYAPKDALGRFVSTKGGDPNKKLNPGTGEVDYSKSKPDPKDYRSKPGQKSARATAVDQLKQATDLQGKATTRQQEGTTQQTTGRALQQEGTTQQTKGRALTQEGKDLKTKGAALTERGADLGKASKVIKVGGNILAGVGVIVDVGVQWSNDSKAHLGNTDKVGNAIGTVAADGVGFVAGMEIGAAIGTAIPLPVVGTIIGAAAGGLIGWAVSAGMGNYLRAGGRELAHGTVTAAKAVAHGTTTAAKAVAHGTATAAKAVTNLAKSGWHKLFG